MKESIEKRVITIVAEQACVPEHEVQVTSKLFDDLGCDSLDNVELVMSIEDEFAIEIPDEEAESAKTVQDIVNLVAARVQQQSTLVP